MVALCSFRMVFVCVEVGCELPVQGVFCGEGHQFFIALLLCLADPR